MIVSNAEIARMLEELAELLEISGENPFRVRAYRNAARTVEGHAKPMSELVAEGADLVRLPGIGEAIARKIELIVHEGALPQLEEARRRVPPVLEALTHVRGLGPKRVKALYDALRVESVEDLRRALREGRVRDLPGFGEQTERLIEEGIKTFKAAEQRVRWLEAEEIARPLVAWLSAVEGVGNLTIAGSYRRRRPTVGDLDILATCRKGAPVMSRLVNYPQVAEVISHGDTRSSVILRSGLQVDLRVVPRASYGAALQYFTGSKAHNIALRRRAAVRNLKLNEYGIFDGDEQVAGRTEKEVYARLGLPFIEPELREDHGEIDAALARKLPRVVKLDDVRGDLHCLTKASDGHLSVEALARAASKRGYQYVAVTDRFRPDAGARKPDPKRLRRQMAAIDRLNERAHRIVVLKGCEVDILGDSALDLPNDVLAAMDLTVCAVHSHFDLSRARQTARLLRAMDNPHFNILAHPTGRLGDERPPMDVDLERIMQGAKERGCILELNAQPTRLDLSDVHCRLAREIGVKVAISSGAQHEAHLDYMRLGVFQARRGWLERDDVVNTRSLAQLRRLLKR